MLGHSQNALQKLWAIEWLEAFAGAVEDRRSDWRWCGNAWGELWIVMLYSKNISVTCKTCKCYSITCKNIYSIVSTNHAHSILISNCTVLYIHNTHLRSTTFLPSAVNNYLSLLVIYYIRSLPRYLRPSAERTPLSTRISISDWGKSLNPFAYLLHLMYPRYVYR